jgi:outer membrane protein TolC
VLFIQGKALRVDTLRAYTSVKNLEPGLLKLQYAIQTGKLRLKALAGIDSLQDIELTDSLLLPSAETIPTEEVVYTAARNDNPDFKLINLREQIADQNVKVTASNRLPVLSAVAQYQIQSQTNNLEYGNAYYPSSSFVGLQLSVPVFNGFKTSARVRQAQLARQQSTLRTKYAAEELRSTVHEVVANNQESVVRLQSAAIVKETAELSYSIIQYRYQRGISSRLELSDAEFSLSTAQSNYLEAIYDYLTARIALDRLMGTI